MPVETLSVHANGIDFACLSAGDGPLVLLLHGFPDRADAWRPILSGLADAGYRAVAPYMRGYHPTAIPADGDYRMPTLGRDAIALARALGAPTAAVVGHDWGATAAYAAANLAPDLFTHLCAVAIPHPRIVRPSLELLWRARHFALYQTGPYGRWYTRRDNLRYIDHLYRYWSPTWADPEAHIAAIQADFRLPGRLDAALGYYAQIPHSLLDNADNRALRARTVQPTLILVGDDDGALRFDKDFRGIEGCFTGPLKVVKVPRAGHFVPAERPDAVLAELVPFLGGPRG